MTDIQVNKEISTMLKGCILFVNNNENLEKKTCIINDKIIAIHLDFILTSPYSFTIALRDDVTITLYSSDKDFLTDLYTVITNLMCMIPIKLNNNRIKTINSITHVELNVDETIRIHRNMQLLI